MSKNTLIPSFALVSKYRACIGERECVCVLLVNRDKAHEIIIRLINSFFTPYSNVQRTIVLLIIYPGRSLVYLSLSHPKSLYLFLSYSPFHFQFTPILAAIAFPSAVVTTLSSSRSILFPTNNSGTSSLQQLVISTMIRDISQYYYRV